MRSRKIIAMVMTFLMMLSLLPSLVFASAVPSGELGGKLKIKGTAAVGSELSADYTKATPEGLSDDYVSFSWSRKTGDQLTEVGTEKTYKLTADDLGNKIQLKITGKSELGVTGELKANTVEIVATPEEAPQETTEDPDAQKNDAQDETVTEDTVEDTQQTEADAQPAEESQEEVIEIGGEPEASADEMQPAEEQPAADAADTSDAAADNAENTQPADTATDDSVIDIGTEDYLEVPEEGQSDSASETGDAADAQPAEEVSYTAEATADTTSEDGTATVDFGTVDAGFTQEESNSIAKTVTISNTGTGTLNFNEISPEHFMVQDIKEPLAAGEQTSVWIMPRAGVEAGEYKDTITYTTEEGTEVSFNADMVVAAADDQTPAEEPAADDQTSTDQPSADDQTPAEEPAADPTPTEEPAADDQTPAEEPAADPTPTEEPSADNQTPADDQTPTEEPAEPTPEVQNSPKIEVADETITDNTVNLGEFAVDADTAATAVTLKNSGTGTVKLAVQTGSDSVTAAFASDSEEIELPADGSTTAALNIEPADTSEAGDFEDTVTVVNAETGEELLALKVSYSVKETPAPELTADFSKVEFDSKEAGYTEAPAAETVTLENTGNVKLTNLTVSISSEFTLGNLSATELDPDQTASFTVAPAVGLAAGSYSQNISIKADQIAEFTIPVSFTVTEAAVKLTAVSKPEDITLANGVEKSAEGLQLPSTVKITTTAGDMNASVAWDVNGCAYNQNSAEAQKFSVNGTVTLPEGVTNPDNLNLIVSVNVSVSRGPIVSDASKNTITGISSDGSYTTETKITFTAVGAGTDIENPIKGDVRYLPLNWEVLESRSWDKAPYSATFRMGKSGNYTLTVTYNQQKFDGSNWVNTGTQDTKQVNFTVAAAPNQTLTPAADKSDANQKNAVKTGDNTPILPFVIILVVAVVLIAGILVYRNKKK